MLIPYPIRGKEAQPNAYSACGGRARLALLERNNYSVDTVYDSEEALAYLESGNYDVLILDIMMPKLDGLAVLRLLREQSCSIPVLSAHTYTASAAYRRERLPQIPGP